MDYVYGGENTHGRANLCPRRRKIARIYRRAGVWGQVNGIRRGHRFCRRPLSRRGRAAVNGQVGTEGTVSVGLFVTARHGYACIQKRPADARRCCNRIGCRGHHRNRTKFMMMTVRHEPIIGMAVRLTKSNEEIPAMPLATMMTAVIGEIARAELAIKCIGSTMQRRRTAHCPSP